MKLTKLFRSAVVATTIATTFVLPAQAEVDMSGKTIEWTIPFSETGGSAKWANFFAPLLSGCCQIHARRWFHEGS